MAFRDPDKPWQLPGITWASMSIVTGLSYARAHALTGISIAIALIVAGVVVAVAFAVIAITLGSLLLGIADLREKSAKGKGGGPTAG